MFLKSSDIQSITLFAGILTTCLCNLEITTERVLLVSFDGFRWNYLNGRAKTPNFDYVKNNGVQARKGIKNAFITKTFPNHYSIATGLYEESHGIVGNTMFDKNLNETFHIFNKKDVTSSKWFDNGGEPIWVTNQRQRTTHRSGVVFWPGAWQAVRDVFPTTSIQGCVFHWSQAVWRHVQELGLAATYRQRGAMHGYIRQLMALPFLPPGHITDTFRALQQRANTPAHITDTFRALQQRANTPALHRLLEYMDNQWFGNAVFSVAEWCVFEKTICTNNDCEGSHNRLNSKAGRLGLTFYHLVPLLRREAEAVAVRVSAADLEREINRRYTKLEEKLQKAWTSYIAHEMSTTHFLKTVSYCYSPPSE